jgi:hypothetical protein
MGRWQSPDRAVPKKCRLQARDMPFWTKKKLIDYDPQNLHLEKLSLLEKSLMAKLLLVNRELVRRYTKLIEASAGLNGMEDGRKIFADGIARRTKLDIVLEDELSRVIGPENSN